MRLYASLKDPNGTAGCLVPTAGESAVAAMEKLEVENTIEFHGQAKKISNMSAGVHAENDQ